MILCFQERVAILLFFSFFLFKKKSYQSTRHTRLAHSMEKLIMQDAPCLEMLNISVQVNPKNFKTAVRPNPRVYTTHAQE